MRKKLQRNDSRRARKVTKLQARRKAYQIWGHSAHGITRWVNIESKRSFITREYFMYII